MATITLSSNIFLSEANSRNPLLNFDSIHQVDNYLLIHKKIENGQSYSASFSTIFTAFFVSPTPISLTIGSSTPINITVSGLLHLPCSGSISIINNETSPYVIRLLVS